jgi:hypothetical protein
MCSNSQGYYGSNNNTFEDVIDNNQSILERIAMISHGGGLIGFADESSALNEIRRLSQPFVGNQVNRAQFLSAPIDNRGYIDLRQVREKRLPKPNKQGEPTMTTQEEFFESLINYIDAAIDEKVGSSYYPEYNVEKKEWTKKELKESLSKFAAELFHGH